MVIVAWTRSSSCCSRTTTGQCATTARHRHTQHLMRERVSAQMKGKFGMKFMKISFKYLKFFIAFQHFEHRAFFIHFHHLFYVFFFAASEREMVYASN